MSIPLSDNQNEGDKLSGSNDSIFNAKIITDEAGNDAPDFSKYADELSRIIVNSSPRFTVGIYGGWGTGKTTLMQMIKNRLNAEELKDDIITVWFDAWRFENEKYMAVIPLIRAINIEIDNRINESYNNTKSVSGGLKKLREGVTKTLIAFLKSSKFNASLNYLGGSAGLDVDIDEFMNIMKSQGTVTIDNEVIHYRKHHITDFLAETVKAFTEENSKRRRIVIFVDDLDRCTPGKALELLESMKTFFDIQGIIYVIGMDPRTIDPIIETKYGKNGNVEGMDYLQKIVQLPFQIPVWTAVDISKTIRNMISKTGMPESDINKIMHRTNIELIIRAAQLNPRDVKRFVNTVMLSKVIYGQTAKDFEKLIAIQAFYFRGSKWLGFLKLITPYFIRNEFLKKFILLVNDESRNISSLEDLNKSITDILNKKNNTSFDKSIEEIFKKLSESKDNDLFFFLKTSAIPLIKIERIDRYLRAVEPISIKETSEITADSGTDTTKLMDLLTTGNVREFNRFREKNRILIVHLPYEDLVSRVVAGKEKKLNLSKINLKDAFLFSSFLSEAKLSQANLTKADLSSADLSEANLSKAELMGADLSNADLSGAKLPGAFLDWANLSDANIEGANLSRAGLSKANLSKAHLRWANLSHANLSQADLSGANLSETDLSHANLSQADLSGANLSKTDLSGADLLNAKLSEANLSKANMSKANLSGADLLNANLSQADLSNAILISTHKFIGIRIDETKLDYAIIDNTELIEYLQEERHHVKNVPEVLTSKQELKERLEEMKLLKKSKEIILNMSNLLD